MSGFLVDFVLLQIPIALLGGVGEYQPGTEAGVQHLCAWSTVAGTV